MGMPGVGPMGMPGGAGGHEAEGLPEGNRNPLVEVCVPTYEFAISLEELRSLMECRGLEGAEHVRTLGGPSGVSIFLHSSLLFPPIFLIFLYLDAPLFGRSIHSLTLWGW